MAFENLVEKKRKFWYPFPSRFSTLSMTNYGTFCVLFAIALNCGMSVIFSFSPAFPQFCLNLSSNMRHIATNDKKETKSKKRKERKKKATVY